MATWRPTSAPHLEPPLRFRVLDRRRRGRESRVESPEDPLVHPPRPRHDGTTARRHDAVTRPFGTWKLLLLRGRQSLTSRRAPARPTRGPTSRRSTLHYIAVRYNTLHHSSAPPREGARRRRPPAPAPARAPRAATSLRPSRPRPPPPRPHRPCRARQWLRRRRAARRRRRGRAEV